MSIFLASFELSRLPLNIDPVAFLVGNFPVRWYSLMYILAVMTVLLLVRWRLSHDNIWPTDNPSWEKNWQIVLEAVIYSFIGLLLGAKLGAIIFYSNPADGWLVQLWPFVNGQFVGYSGMSYHGGLIGSFLSGYLYCRKNKLSFFRLAEYIIPAIPLGYFWGRIGNFINGELYGRLTNKAWGMYFPNDPQGWLRHPSQLYEAFGEGILIFLVLWPLRNYPALQGNLLALYLILYGSIRFILEFFREPEIYVGPLTMGQLLCLAMIFIGLIIILNKKFKLKVSV